MTKIFKASERRFEANGSPPVEGWQPQADGVVKRDTENFMSLPYNPDLKRLAQKLRRAGNIAEVLFWEQVKNRRFKNYDFDRQKIIGNYIVDFFCANCKVVIEIDGGSHEYKQESDEKRDAFLRGLGLEVIRISHRDIRKNMSGVMDMLFDHPAMTTPSVVPTATPPQEGNRVMLNH
jgi:very-short-patch-repair endonuclease